MYRAISSFATRRGRLPTLLALALAAGFASPIALATDEPPDPPPLTTMQWQLLEKLINDRANEIANSRQFFEEDRRPTEVVATLDPTTKVLRLDLDVSFGRLVGDLELEDFQSQIRVGMEDLTGQIPGFNTTDWRIGGRDMDYWFDQDFPLPERIDAESVERKFLKAFNGGQLTSHPHNDQLAEAERLDAIPAAERDLLQRVRDGVAEFISVDDFDGEELRANVVSNAEKMKAIRAA